ncbi:MULTISPECIES: M24 family metallopeptidase [unclassified Leptolyngbya]|uniref:M24 family metallopeptidase n=1 Tax=unclassified Leptolyngbya TaxID=2650499 RepID=UPI001682F041|nr:MULTISPECIES: M24 family metallopeptidase [unclassified Leptolyngbya]MBD1909817.1 M24 family metallopeptidase [Leptolyngbya sp. FACHB-8]MBD2158968.1 M24 family metallopeptidase [Leptolyngbya sp. FACHB-16]
MNRLEEVSTKLEFMRGVLHETEAAGIRLRGTDWFAWATAGGSNTVLLAAETGVAEVLVTPTDAWILTDTIEAERLKDEELPEGSSYKLSVNPWAKSSDRESFVQEATNNGKILSDKPAAANESSLPQSLTQHRWVMLPSEVERYRQVGRLASEAMTEVLMRAEPNWTEYQLAGAGAEAMWARGLHPALTLAAGDRRLPIHRHPLPSGETLGRQAMLVFCARGHGLVISLTRFVFFEGFTQQDQQLHRTIAEIEAEALNNSQIGTPLNAVYNVLATAYKQHGYPNAIREHHQGGTASYGARDVVANPETTSQLAANMAVAWNPSIPGAKIEDTFLLTSNNTLENLSFDPKFPHAEVEGRLRAVPLER